MGPPPNEASLPNVAAWLRLEQEALQAHCDALLLAPASPLFLFSSNLGEQAISLSHIAPSFAAAAQLRETPTTILADGNWTVLWEKVGVLGPKDERIALQVIGP